MELAAAIAALNFLKGHSQPITVYTDSVYVIRGITQWVFGWQKRNWTNSEGADVANRELWEELMTATRGRKVSWQYVRGHVGIVGNERADKIAVQETAGDHVELYAGPLSGYGLDIRQVPDDTSVPEMRSSAGKPKKALAYFSFVDGKVRRHTDWSSCERLVKGRSGAKFKKVMTEAEADELLAQWGFSASDVSV
jgi:ribonuclease HI